MIIFFLAKWGGRFRIRWTSPSSHLPIPNSGHPAYFCCWSYTNSNNQALTSFWSLFASLPTHPLLLLWPLSLWSSPGSRPAHSQNTGILCNVAVFNSHFPASTIMMSRVSLLHRVCDDVEFRDGRGLSVSRWPCCVSQCVSCWLTKGSCDLTHNSLWTQRLRNDQLMRSWSFLPDACSWCWRRMSFIIP